MTFEEAEELIASFSDSAPLLGNGSISDADKLEVEFGRALPPELREYVTARAPEHDLEFETVGNPITLWGTDQLSQRADGYSWNPVTESEIEDWSHNWLVIGDEGGDPIIVDLAQAGPECPVLSAPHGEGVWEFRQLAPSLSVFLALAAAQHHALTAFVPQMEAIIDDDRGFNLCEEAAQWYFPFVRRVCGQHYGEWTSVFDNS